MTSKTILLAVLVSCFVMASAGCGSKIPASPYNSPTYNQTMDQDVDPESASVPETKQLEIDRSGYVGSQGLVAFHELKILGYRVDAEFDDPALTSASGKASDFFELLDPFNPEQRENVKSFIVKDMTQQGVDVVLIIGLRPAKENTNLP